MPADANTIDARSEVDRVRRLKNAIYGDICDEISENGYQNIDWMFVSETSLRLTPMGLKFMMDRYDHREFKLEKALTGRQLISLKERCRLPFYVATKKVVLFEPRHIFKVELMGGISEWLR